MTWLESIGDDNVLMLTGLLVGLLFGGFGQHSGFCLRAATVEFWHGRFGKRLAVWLLVFGSAFSVTQWQVFSEHLEVTDIRQLNGVGSISGAIIGGLLFGTGMILARGCASRVLILSGTGNMRAFVTGLLLTIVAQASYRGILSPLREQLSALWTINGSERYLATYWWDSSGLLLALIFLGVAGYFAWRIRLSKWVTVSALITGGSIGLGWWLTAWQASWSFEIIRVQSVTFTGPSADTLMAIINEPSIPRNFGTGLVPGVFIGALLASLMAGQFKLQSFSADTGTLRYLIGACLMGFGGMLAGGCAVGAGVTGGAVLATTAWVALLAMWLSAGAADRLFNKAPS